ncbi:protein-tyrosine phosphatase-like protein [Daldinia caldariorum]|uniref:protein-tyrosine phosphatase-like protein n=1 Tax=Daldinia caldariorum TaxID=326644 RepID=UPI0020089770|nr:protein-tyrosine phosphatase-like protein [Daldinia caldariorum]KAI1468460.1 protein-tyrosine phosphatase-like protein [Daldinia caldariorum]
MSVAFDNILNFRDVGKTINDYLGRKVLREGVFYRSARPDDASPIDRKRLKDELGIRTVVDLRSKTELLKQAQKRQAAATALPALSNTALAEQQQQQQQQHPLQIPGLRYRTVKVTGRRFEIFLLRQLAWWSFFKFLLLFLLGYRTQAIAILGREVMQPRGLVGLGIAMLDESGAEIAEALHTLTTPPSSSSPSSLPLLIHCTQGKDRTGLVVLLALAALGVPPDAISHDYLLSRAGGLAAKGEDKGEAEERLLLEQDIREIGLTPEWADVPDDFVEKILGHLHGKYGGVENYLRGVGFGNDERERLVEVLGA